MINLNKFENKKSTEFSYTFSNNIIDIFINKRLDESLVFYHENNNYKINLICKENASCELIEIFDKIPESVSETKMEIYGNVNHTVLAFSKLNLDKNECINVYKDASYVLNFIDLSKGKSTVKNAINLLQEHSSSHINFASYVDGKFVKEVINKINNNARYTEGYINNYGISFDEGRLHIKGIGNISKGSSKSISEQKSTMYVMDEKSYANNEPILLIDEDDVQASHASAVGQIDEDTIFYLCSRGISKKIARKLVVLGEFKSYISNIQDEESKKIVSDYLQEVIENV